VKRFPELVVFLALPVVANLLYQWQCAVERDWSAPFEARLPESMLTEAGRYRIWETPPGPLRDMLHAGLPGILLGSLTLFAAIVVGVAVVRAIRRPGRAPCSLRRAATTSFRVAVLSALLATACAGDGVSKLTMETMTFQTNPLRLLEVLGPSLSTLRLGALLAAGGVGAALTLGLVCRRRV